MPLLLAACSFVDPAQPHPGGVPAGEITAGRNVGQTFQAHHDGLNGIEILLATYSRTNTEPVVFHLRPSPDSEEDLRTATIYATEIADNEFYHFAFSPILDSKGNQYYLALDSPTSTPGNAITAWLNAGDSYQDGSAYTNGQPNEAQMTFKLHYAPGWMGLGILKTLISPGISIALATLVILLPGGALSVYLLPSERLDWRVRLALAPALGVALYPVILAWCLLINVRPGATMVWGTAFLSAVMLIIRLRRLTPAELAERGRSAWRAWQTSGAWCSDLTTLLVIALIVFALFVPIQQFAAPLWDDSVQHAVISQRIYEHGGLFESWEPYAPYRTLTTHFGFHTAVAAYMWVTGTHVAKAMLIVGQLVNLVGALGLYALTLLVSRNRWAGIGTLIVVGLFSVVPAMYTNWGRYPQLMGQAILPAAICLLWAVGESGRRSRGLILAAGLAAAGMTLSYYRTPFLYALFCAAWLAVQAIPAWLRRKRAWWRDLVRLGMVASTLVVLMAPWVAMGLSKFPQLSPTTSGPSPPPLDLWEMYEPWWRHAGYRSLLLGGLASSLVAILLRRWRTVTLTGWLVGFLVLPLVSSYTRNNSFLFATMIAIYIPTGLLLGILVGLLARALVRRTELLVRPLTILAIVGAAAYGMLGMLRTLDPQYALVTSPDLEAMAWIRENTASDAIFLINGILYTDGHSVVGGDAGWWLPIFSQRANSIPPQYAMFTAEPVEPGYTQRVNNLVHTLLANAPTTPDALQALCDFGITHVYIGQRRGMAVAALPVSIRPEKPMLDVDELEASKLFNSIHRNDRVRVFLFDRTVCTSQSPGASSPGE